jgi:hypothetical protein
MGSLNTGSTTNTGGLTAEEHYMRRYFRPLDDVIRDTHILSFVTAISEEGQEVKSTPACCYFIINKWTDKHHNFSQVKNTHILPGYRIYPLAEKITKLLQSS